MQRQCKVCDRWYDPAKVRQGVPQGMCSRTCAQDRQRLRANEKAARRRVPPRVPRALFGASSRDWSQAVAKKQGAVCRVCGNLPVEAAHIVPRSVAPNAGETEDAIVPLCREHHRQYDEGGGLDLLPYLTLPEQAHAVVAAGGIIGALRITTGKRDVA